MECLSESLKVFQTGISPLEVNLMSADNRLNCFVLFAQSAFCCFDTNPGFALKKYFKSSHFRFKVA